MTQRITPADLNAVVDRINHETNSSAEPYTKGTDGKHRANIGAYHLSRAYRGYSLDVMVNDSGGVRDVFGCGHTTARDLYNRMHALLAGMHINKGEKK